MAIEAAIKAQSLHNVDGLFAIETIAFMELTIALVTVMPTEYFFNSLK